MFCMQAGAAVNVVIMQRNDDEHRHLLNAAYIQKQVVKDFKAVKSCRSGSTVCSVQSQLTPPSAVPSRCLCAPEGSRWDVASNTAWPCM